jgi:hypothetical protein
MKCYKWQIETDNRNHVLENLQEINGVVGDLNIKKNQTCSKNKRKNKKWEKTKPS